MDTNETVIETPNSDSFVKDIAKGVAINAAVTVGSMAVLVAVGFAAEKFEKIRAARKAKKEAQIEAA